MHLLFIATYVLLCLLAAFLGRKTRMGPWVIFVLALFITPIATFLLLLLFGDQRKATSSGVAAR